MHGCQSTSWMRRFLNSDQHMDIQANDQNVVSYHSKENASGHGLLYGQLHHFFKSEAITFSFCHFSAASFDCSCIWYSLFCQLRCFCQCILLRPDLINLQAMQKLNWDKYKSQCISLSWKFIIKHWLYLSIFCNSFHVASVHNCHCRNRRNNSQSNHGQFWGQVNLEKRNSHQTARSIIFIVTVPSLRLQQ